MSPTDQELVAIHEAGHAVAAVFLGREISVVSVINRSDSSGRLFFSGIEEARFAAQERWFLETTAMTRLAGPLAERRMMHPYGWMHGPIDWRACSGKVDSGAASRLVERSAPEGRDALTLAILLSRTFGVLVRPQVWKAVEATAEELSKHRVLRGALVSGGRERRDIASYLSQEGTEMGFLASPADAGMENHISIGESKRWPSKRGNGPGPPGPFLQFFAGLRRHP